MFLSIQLSRSKHAGANGHTWSLTRPHGHIHASARMSRMHVTQVHMRRHHSVTSCSLSHICANTSVREHLSCCSHLRWLPSNSTYPQIVYRALQYSSSLRGGETETDDTISSDEKNKVGQPFTGKRAVMQWGLSLPSVRCEMTDERNVLWFNAVLLKRIHPSRSLLWEGMWHVESVSCIVIVFINSEGERDKNALELFLSVPMRCTNNNGSAAQALEKEMTHGHTLKGYTWSL